MTAVTRLVSSIGSKYGRQRHTEYSDIDINQRRAKGQSNYISSVIRSRVSEHSQGFRDLDDLVDIRDSIIRGHCIHLLG